MYVITTGSMSYYLCAFCAWSFLRNGINMSSSRIFENFTAKWTLCVQQFFSAKVAIIKTKGATITFSPVLLSSFSLLSFSFISGLVSVILELIAPKSLPFDAFSLKWRQNFVRLVFKKIGLHITSEGRGGRNGSYQTRNIYQYPDVTDSTSVRWELEPFQVPFVAY